MLRKSPLLATVVVAFATIHLVWVSPAIAADPVGVNITSATGTIVLPPTCAVKNPSGGCISWTSGFQMSSGATYLQPCAAENVYVGGGSLPGPCQFHNGSGGPLSGDVIVGSGGDCASFQIWFRDTGTAKFTDAAQSDWNVKSLVIPTSNGTPVGLGYAWDVTAGSLRAENAAGTLRISIDNLSGSLTSSNVCSSVQSVTQFGLNLQGVGTVSPI